jgi:hypothetical protein
VIRVNDDPRIAVYRNASDLVMTPSDFDDVLYFVYDRDAHYIGSVRAKQIAPTLFMQWRGATAAPKPVRPLRLVRTA